MAAITAPREPDLSPNRVNKGSKSAIPSTPTKVDIRQSISSVPKYGVKDQEGLIFFEEGIDDWALSLIGTCITLPDQIRKYIFETLQILNFGLDMI
jgi:hypothetical protein